MLLASCSDSETDHEKKTKMIETCADYEYKDHFKKRIFGDLSIKLNNRKYQRGFEFCETYLKKNPITFKEKYLD